MKAICILDGDHKSDLNNNIVALPGKTEVKSGEMFSPEQLLFNYASILYGEDDDFWVNDAVISIGYGKRVYIERISNRLAEFKKQKDEGTTTKKNREFSKELFKENIDFFYLLFKRWLNDERTSSEKCRFFKELKILFRKNAQYNGINPNEWKDE